jgi:hypothetical protein
MDFSHCSWSICTDLLVVMVGPRDMVPRVTGVLDTLAEVASSGCRMFWIEVFVDTEAREWRFEGPPI